MEYRKLSAPFDNYEISETGVVRKKETGSELRRSLNNFGNYTCILFNPEKKKYTSRGIARLVAEAYMGFVPEKGARVILKNGDAKDIRIDNIEILDKSTEQKRAYENGRVPAGRIGEKVHIFDCKTDLYLGWATSTNAAAKMTGVGQATVSLIINGKYDKDNAKGFRYERG